MKNLKNRVQLIGRLGRDPEVKSTKTGKTIARFSLATTETFRDKSGEKRKDVQWHNLVAWNKLAEIASEYLSKGSEIAVDGKIVYRTYEDKEGQVKYFTEVIVNELLMMGKPAKQQKQKLKAA